MKKFLGLFFYGNIFYSLCAVALCFETNLQHKISINRFPFYLLIFFCTWLYYTRIYYRSTSAKFANARTQWYRINKKIIRYLLLAVLVLVVAVLLILLFLYYNTLEKLSVSQWVLIFLFPVVASLYTFSIPLPYLKKTREISWLKPFIIGFTWAGVVTVYPLMVVQIQNMDQEATYPSLLYFLNNFLFISVLAVIFDIKDYSADLVFRLKTFPTLLGVQKTVRRVIIPLAIINMIIFAFYHLQAHTSVAGIILQSLSFVLLFIILQRLPKMNKLLHYLLLVDGLMLLKGLLGIISVTIF
ncbi:MAG: hypothetical protein JWQ96_1184 [Segetibacter sp.]|nr:hypothetical protein [Segetibacter sp.]